MKEKKEKQKNNVIDFESRAKKIKEDKILKVILKRAEKLKW